MNETKSILKILIFISLLLTGMTVIVMADDTSTTLSGSDDDDVSTTISGPSGDTPPEITSTSPSSPITIERTNSQTFSAEINQTSDNYWDPSWTSGTWDNGTTSTSKTYTFDSEGSYTLTITAYNPNNNTLTDSYTWDITVEDTVSPSPPSNLEWESNISCVWWTWNNPSDSDFSHIEVYIDGAHQTDTTNEEYTSCGHSPCTTLNLSIRAVDNSGNPSNWKYLEGTVNTISLETLSATNIATNGATLKGNVTALNTSCVSTNNATIWFKWGKEQGTYPFSSDNVTVNSTGIQTKDISSLTMLSGSTYYYKICGYAGVSETCGEEKNFTTSSLSSFEYSFGGLFDELVEADWDAKSLVEVLPKTYTQVVGSMFWGILFGMIFMGMWIRQESITIPCILGLIIGGALWSFLPPEWVRIAYILIIVSLASLMFSIVLGRRGENAQGY